MEVAHFTEQEFLLQVKEAGIVPQNTTPEISGDIDDSTSFVLQANYKTRIPIHLVYTVKKDTGEVVAVQLTCKKEIDGDMQSDFVEHARKLIRIMDSSITQEEANEFVTRLKIKEANGDIELTKNKQIFFVKVPDTGVVFAIYPQQ